MKKRRFFILSLGLAILGLCAHLLAMGYVGRSVHLRALAFSKPEVERSRMKAEADSQLHRFPFFEYPSMAFAISSVVFLVFSARKHEPAWRSVTFAVLCGYVMSHFLLI
jgi:hypothetical protein